MDNIPLPQPPTKAVEQPGLIAPTGAVVKLVNNLIVLPAAPKEDPRLVEQAKKAEVQRAEEARLAEEQRIAAEKAEQERIAQEQEQARLEAEQEQQAEAARQTVSYQNTYVGGQCTWYVATRRSVPNNWGNANTWLYNARAQGWATGWQPKVGAIAWTDAGYYGHVAIVEEVSSQGVLISEMNASAGPYNVDQRWADPSEFQYIY